MPEEITFEGRGVYAIGIDEYNEMKAQYVKDAQIAALNAKLARVRSLVIEMRSRADCKVVMEMYVDDILREVGYE